MAVFMLIMIIVLTISNVLLWLVCKGLQIMLKRLAEKTVELCKCMISGGDTDADSD